MARAVTGMIRFKAAEGRGLDFSIARILVTTRFDVERFDQQADANDTPARDVEPVIGMQS